MDNLNINIKLTREITVENVSALVLEKVPQKPESSKESFTKNICIK